MLVLSENKTVHSSTHILKAVFTQLLGEKQRTQHSKPHKPTEHLLHFLNIHHAKYKDKLVKNKVPELVPHVLLFDFVQSTKHKGVEGLRQKKEETTSHIQNSLQGDCVCICVCV